MLNMKKTNIKVPKKTQELWDRAIMFGQFIADNNSTIRACAANFDISKSTVHKDVQQRLRNAQPQLFERVQAVLLVNTQERTARGGEATKQKYLREKSKV